LSNSIACKEPGCHNNFQKLEADRYTQGGGRGKEENSFEWNSRVEDGKCNYHRHNRFE